MPHHSRTQQETASRAVANEPSANPQQQASTPHFVDQRPEAVFQRKMKTMADSSPQVGRAKQVYQLANGSNPSNVVQRNDTGLPDQLKSGIEKLSGHSMDDVRVHRNSSKPAQLHANAYAQGSDIHLGPGQERHLPHEAWHVAQQKQGRVKPTTKLDTGGSTVPINDNQGLEKEADMMGTKALGPIQRKEKRVDPTSTSSLPTQRSEISPSHEPIIQPEETEGTQEAAPAISPTLTKLKKWVYKEIHPSKFEQFGIKRERWEKLKKEGRRIVNQEITTQIQDEELPESSKALKETRAKKNAYSATKVKVNKLVDEVAMRIARQAMETQQGKSGQAALKEDQIYANAKSEALVLLTQFRSQIDTFGGPDQSGPMAGPAPVVENLEEEVESSVTGVAAQSIKAANSEEGVGKLGKLLDTVIPDPGDGVALNLKIEFPVMSDPSGAAQLYMFIEANGKAGRGTEGYVTAGLPAIAQNKNHLELESNFNVGLKAVAGLKGLAGIDFSESFEAFARAGADSTEAAMAAYRYGIYRGIGIKSLAALWYGGREAGTKLTPDYLEAEQRAAAVEDQYFRAEGMEGTFSDTGVGGKVGFSAQAGKGLGALGAEASVSGGVRVFSHFDKDVLGDTGTVPKTREEALKRRQQVNGKLGKSLAAQVSKSITFGGQKFDVSGAVSGGSLTNWGIEIKGGITSSMAAGSTSMDFIITLANAMYELEHKLLSAIGKHMDAPPPADHVSKKELQDQLAKSLIKRNAAITAMNMAHVGLSAAGIGSSTMAVSVQLGMSDGKFKTRFDIINSTALAVPESIPVVSGSIEKETRFMAGEFETGFKKGTSKGTFMSPGVQKSK